VSIDSLGTPRSAGYRELPAPAALPHLTAFRIIDVRQPEEFARDIGRIAGSENVPLGGVAAAAADWDRTEPLLLVCRGGFRSANAATQLAAMGFTKLYNLNGGMMGWAQSGFPTER
jgi:rhodanese-related sulfurtransferase